MADNPRKILWYCLDSRELIEKPFEIIENADDTLDFKIWNRGAKCYVKGGSKLVEFERKLHKMVSMKTRVFDEEGCLHNTRGPAVIEKIYSVGDYDMFDHKKWRFEKVLERFNHCKLIDEVSHIYFDGNGLSEEEFVWLNDNYGLPTEENPITESDLLQFRLRWSR